MHIAILEARQQRIRGDVAIGPGRIGQPGVVVPGVAIDAVVPQCRATEGTGSINPRRVERDDRVRDRRGAAEDESAAFGGAVARDRVVGERWGATSQVQPASFIVSAVARDRVVHNHRGGGLPQVQPTAVP